MKEYLFCVDSDGCAMDTMTIKHVKCFGPDLIKEWELFSWEKEILTRWNEINLYTIKRGINRFQGLALMLEEVDAAYTKIEGLQALKAWVENTEAFSEKSLEQEIEKYPKEEILKKALSWSQQVNRDITALSQEEKVAFSGVDKALAMMKASADLAIVSSANREALEEEWQRCGLMEHVDYAMAQDVGTKTACILSLIEKGYNPDNILMIGDAKGDYKAAKQAGVHFYPILAGSEEASWQDLKERVIALFVAGAYTEEVEQKMLAKFYENLGDK